MIANTSFDTAKLQTNFFGWVDKAESQGHFSKGNVSHIKVKFQELFAKAWTSHSVADAEHGKLGFYAWVDRTKNDGHFNNGQSDHIKDAFAKAFTHSCTKQPQHNLQTDLSLLHDRAVRNHFIPFYDSKDPLTEFLGNFYPCRIDIWGLRFQCAEAAFQAAKFRHDRAMMETFCNLDGHSAWQRAGKLSQSLPSNWGQSWAQVRDQVMREVLEAKFGQNPDLKQRLLATGKAYLVEHNTKKGKDAHWSDDHDGTGENMLGQLLMALREKLGGGEVGHPPHQYWQFIKAGH